MESSEVFLIFLFGNAISLALYTPVFISDLVSLIIMGYDTLFGYDSEYSISILTKLLSPLMLMGMGQVIRVI